MKLSVVIPVYNGADFIQKSYESILGQGLEDFEILYVDNNSTDQSLERIKKIQQKDIRVKCYQQMKKGAAPARNMGIAYAQGDFIYLFDVDDEIYPHALKRMLAILEDYPAVDAVFGKMVKSAKSISETVKPTDETGKVIFKETPYWGLQWFTDLKTVVGPPAFLYRKEVFEQIGCYNEDLKIGQDTALDIKLGMTSSIAFLDSYVYLYFKHPNSSLEQAKKNENQIFNLWSRLVKSHLPFYFENEVPVRYKELLFRQLFSSMGKIIYYTKSLRLRKQLFKQIEEDVNPISIPFFIRFYLVILVFLPIRILLKFYIFYWTPYYLNRHIKTF